jgi:hypothetical protein
MGFRPSKRNFRAFVASLAMCFLGLGVLLGQDTNGPTASTGGGIAPEQASRRDKLKELENDLFGPLKRLMSQSSAPDTHISQRPTPPPTAAQTKHARELEDRRKNWGYLLDPDTFNSSVSEKDSLKKTKDSAEDKDKDNEKLSAGERYYLNLKRPNKNAFVEANKNDKERSSLSPVRPGIPGDTVKAGSDKLPAEVNESAQALTKLFGKDGDSGDKQSDTPQQNRSASSLFSGIFGSEPTVQTKDEIDAHKARMDEFRQLLTAPPAAGNSLNPVGTFSERRSSTPAPYLGSSMPAGSGSQSLSPFQFGTIGSGSSGSGAMLPDASTPRALSLPSLTAQPMKIEQPKWTPPAPSFTAPRRAF